MRMKTLCTYSLLSWLFISCICLVQGCSSTGFSKRATLMPDSIGISISQERYKGEDEAWQGISFNAQWNLK